MSWKLMGYGSPVFMGIEDLGGKIAGGLEVIFHHPLRPIKDYHMWVDEAHTLCRSSWLTPADITWLLLNKVTIVVNLCKERNDDSRIKNFGMVPVNIPILDGSSPTIEQADQFLHEITGRVADVHCEAGHGRTGCMVAYYRVKVQGWTVGSALQEAQFIGHLEPNQVKWIQEIK